MRDFPSCFGESGVQVVDFSSGSSRTAQSLVTCVYQSRLYGRPCLITIQWSKNLMGQGLCVGIDCSSNHCLCKVDIKPWLFSKRKGSKSLEVGWRKVHIFWDLSSAKFGSGPEPLEDFYLAVVFDSQMVLLLGDLSKEAYRKTNARPPPSIAAFISKKEHISGKRVYGTKAQFWDNGPVHDVSIECETSCVKDPCLLICIDKKIVIKVKHLTWKFRGNQTILVDGLPVDVLWDVYNWLFSATVGSAVFMFKTSLSAEKLWSFSGNLSGPCVLPWSSSQMFRETQLQAATRPPKPATLANSILGPSPAFSVTGQPAINYQWSTCNVDVYNSSIHPLAVIMDE